MRYVEFRDLIQATLRSAPDGRTWQELKAELELPYQTPCPTWVAHLEDEIGLTRTREGRSKVWRVPARRRRRAKDPA